MALRRAGQLCQGPNDGHPEGHLTSPPASLLIPPCSQMVSRLEKALEGSLGDLQLVVEEEGSATPVSLPFLVHRGVLALASPVVLRGALDLIKPGEKTCCDMLVSLNHPVFAAQMAQMVIGIPHITHKQPPACR